MLYKLYIILCVLIVFCGDIKAGTILDYVPDVKYVSYGKNIDCIVKVIGKQNDKSSSEFSGVIIDPHWMLTSAHTIENKLKFSFILSDGKIIAIDDIYVHPKFNPNEFCSVDVALCYFKEKIKISFIPELYESDDEIGKIACISGFGITGTGLTGAIKWDNKKRAGSNFIDSIEKNMLICSMSNRNERVTALEFCISPGDSGGGLFIDKKLAGINSFVIHKHKSLKSKYGDMSGHTRISNKDCLSWIKYIIYDK